LTPLLMNRERSISFYGKPEKPEGIIRNSIAGSIKLLPQGASWVRTEESNRSAISSKGQGWPWPQEE